MNKIASNTIYQLVGKVVSMSITVFIVMIITRSYGREGYGAFSLMQTWPALFFVIVDFGMNAIATRELSKDWSKVEKYLGTILIVRIIFSLILMALLAGILILFPYSSALKFGIILSLALILTQALFTTTNVVFQVKQRYDLSTVGYLAGYMAVLVLASVVSYLNLDVAWVSFSYVIGGIITFALNWSFIKSLGVHPQIKVDRETLRYLLVSSLPLGLMFVFSQVNFKVDSILLSVLSLPGKYGLTNTESVAVYSLPYKVFEVALVVPTFVMNSVFPVLVRKMGTGKEELKSIFIKTIFVLGGIAIIGGIGGFLFAPQVISVLGGNDFSQSVVILRILLAGLLFYFLTQPLAWLIVTLGYQKYLPFIYLVGAVFNTAANYIFIQKYSFYASSIITHCSELLILIMLIYFARRCWRRTYAQV